MSEASHDRDVYKAAKDFIKIYYQSGVTPKDIRSHLDPPDSRKRVSMDQIYEQLLVSAQSPNMMPSVIGKSLDGGVPRLKPVLCGFCPQNIVEEYHDDWRKLLNNIVAEVAPRGKVRRRPRCIWPRFCRAALSGARFLARFRDGNHFNNWVSRFDDDRARAALPLLLAKEIRGFGFAVAADFLKEVGHRKYAKPDVHLHDIFKATGLAAPDAGDYEVFNAVQRVAKNVKQTPYHVDKLFWLIGSGNFHSIPMEVPGQKKEFIKATRRRGLNRSSSDARNH